MKFVFTLYDICEETIIKAPVCNFCNFLAASGGKVANRDQLSDRQGTLYGVTPLIPFPIFLQRLKNTHCSFKSFVLGTGPLNVNECVLLRTPAS